MYASRKLLLVTAAILLAPFAIAAQTQDPSNQKEGQAPAFEKLDRNADGVITAAEAEDTWLADRFAMADSNRDGRVTKAEYGTVAS